MKTSGGYAWITDSATKGRTEKKRKTILADKKRKTIVADRRRRGGSKKRRKIKTSVFF